MSSVYNLEPQPTAKVLLRTSAGDIELELFAKQTPLASRNFLQLCLDGYYDNTIFHRLIPGFIVQGGDPTGTGSGGESSINGGEPFADEFHSRLKFNRRGLLGMANTGEKNDNGSQFFLTLGNTEELTGKNTMFGRVVGDTIYNLMKIGEAELAEDGSDRPLYPTKVLGADILVNPFEGMVKKEQVQMHTSVAEKKIKKKPKRKAGKDLLSFGIDEEEENDVVQVIKKAKFNPQLIDTEKPTKAKSQLSKQKPLLENGPKPNGKAVPISPPQRKQASPSPETSVKEVSPPPIMKAHQKPRPPSSSPEPRPSKLEKTNQQIEALKQSMRRNVDHDNDKQSRSKSLLVDMIPANTTRGRKRNGPINAKQERKALDAFNAFRSKLESASAFDSSTAEMTDATKANVIENRTPPSNNADAEDEAALCDLHFIAGCQSCREWDDRPDDVEADDQDTGWMGHALSFAKDRLGKDLEWKRKSEHELVVIDPREKAKALGVEKIGQGKTKDDQRWGKVDQKVMRRQ